MATIQNQALQVIRDNRPGWTDITPLKNAGWEYIHRGNHILGQWIDPLTKTRHLTNEALKREAKRKEKAQ